MFNIVNTLNDFHELPETKVFTAVPSDKPILLNIPAIWSIAECTPVSPASGDINDPYGFWFMSVLGQFGGDAENFVYYINLLLMCFSTK